MPTSIGVGDALILKADERTVFDDRGYPFQLTSGDVVLVTSAPGSFSFPRGLVRDGVALLGVEAGAGLARGRRVVLLTSDLPGVRFRLGEWYIFDPHGFGQWWDRIPAEVGGTRD